jgi:peptidoglycan/xylan/chitin deacetylase (PgdA/CDA1 family)
MVRRILRTFVKPLIPGPLIRYRGPAEHRRVALTFDDGPTSGRTDRVLSVLESRKAPATFFIIGERALRCPGLLQAMHQQGCELANHSFSHPRLARLPLADVQRELAQTDAIIQEITGREAPYFRPPRGEISLRLLWHLFRLGRLPLILWSACSGREFTKTPDEVVADLRGSRLRPGDIILLHDDNPRMSEALPAVLDLLAERDLEPVTLRELFREPHAAFPDEVLCPLHRF